MNHVFTAFSQLKVILLSSHLGSYPYLLKFFSLFDIFYVFPNCIYNIFKTFFVERGDNFWIPALQIGKYYDLIYMVKYTERQALNETERKRQ